MKAYKLSISGWVAYLITWTISVSCFYLAGQMHSLYLNCLGGLFFIVTILTGVIMLDGLHQDPEY